MQMEPTRLASERSCHDGARLICGVRQNGSAIGNTRPRTMFETEGNRPTSKDRLDEESGAKRDDLALQVHLAEYAALTMRNTYWITLQFAAWPILLLYWAFAASMWDTVDRTVLLWVTGLITQQVVLNWCQAGYEIYNNAKYIEHELRPLVRSLVQVDGFWGYEPFLKSQRTTGPMWFECWPALGSAAALALLVYYTRPWSIGDWLGAGLNFCFLAAVVVRTKMLVKARLAISESA